jgi:hypothetical protein
MTVESGGITITIGDIVLEPGMISDDYDAERAAQIIKDEMLKIAAQTGNLTIDRR